MGIGGALFAVSAAQAVGQISQGYAQSAEADYNATVSRNAGEYNGALLDDKGRLIDVQSSIDQGQYTRSGGRLAAQSTATIAKQGTGIEGSALAVMIRNETELNIDKAISKLNFDTDKNYTAAEASQARRQGNLQADSYKRAGKAAVTNGYTGAFSSLLQGASNYAMYKGSKSTTFEYNNKQQNPLEAFGGGTTPYVKPRMSIFR